MAVNIKIGSKVELKIKDDYMVRRPLMTRVEALLDKKEALLLMPKFANKLVRLPIGEGYEAHFHSDGKFLIYDISIIEHPQIDGIYLTKIRMDSAEIQIQLRDYFRVELAIPFEFSLDSDAISVRHNGQTRDISGGGMSFLSDFQMEKGATLFASFDFDSNFITIQSQIMNAESSKTEDFSFLYRCKFENLSDAEQDIVLKYINNRQYK